MFRRESLLTTGKLPKFEHVFSSKKHFIFRSYEQETLETYLTKRMVVKDQKVLHYYKHHIYNQILPYLLRHHYSQQASILQIHPSYAEVMVQAKYTEHIAIEDSDNQQDEEPTEQDGNTIFISKRLIYGLSLREMILNKDQRLDKQFCVDLVGAIVDFILGRNGIRDLMITSENIIIEDSGYFHLNYFSFVGLQFVKFDKYITRAEFEEILPFLTTKFIKEGDPKMRKIDVWMQLKFIMLNFYSAFFKKDLIFDPKYLDLDVEVRRTDQRVIKAVQNLESLLLPKLKTAEHQKISQIDKCFKVNYSSLMQEVLRSDGEVREKMNWQYILANLCRSGQQQTRSIFNNEEQQFENYFIGKNQSKFAIHVFQVVDLYITLANIIGQEVPVNEQSKDQQKILKIFKKAKELDLQRTALLERKRYSHSLFIPIKVGIKFTNLLRYKNWVDMLNSATSTDTLTLQAIHKLIHFIIDIRHNLVELQPLITNRIINLAIRKQPSYLQSTSVRNLLQHLQSISNELRPISEQLDSPTLQQRNLKAQFWKITFCVLNQLLLLAKRFFLKVTARTIKGNNMSVNRNDFATIVEYIEPYIPPITVIDNS